MTENRVKNLRLDKRHRQAYNTNNNKKINLWLRVSKQACHLDREPRTVEKRWGAVRWMGLWGQSKRTVVRVSLTGSPPVIKGACMLVYGLKWAIYRQFGWYRRLMELVPCVRGRLFLMFCPNSMGIWQWVRSWCHMVGWWKINIKYGKDKKRKKEN